MSSHFFTFILQQTISAFNTYLLNHFLFFFENQNVICIFNKHTMLFLLFHEQNTIYKSQFAIQILLYQRE